MFCFLKIKQSLNWRQIDLSLDLINYNNKLSAFEKKLHY